MFEAVGRKNFKSFFLKVKELLSDDGLFLLQTIASNNAWTTKGDPWIGKYIFPNGELPSLSQITSAIESKNQNNQIFVVEDVHNIGSDYDKTLMQWWRNFDSGYESLYKENPKYDKKFYRMWKFYLQYCAGMFRSRFIQDYQIIFSKKGMLGGYISKR
jgi:cyclopropane-fatty-acyl-phospholipid synthase